MLPLGVANRLYMDIFMTNPHMGPRTVSLMEVPSAPHCQRHLSETLMTVGFLFHRNGTLCFFGFRMSSHDCPLPLPVVLVSSVSLSQAPVGRRGFCDRFVTSCLLSWETLLAVVGEGGSIYQEFINQVDIGLLSHVRIVPCEVKALEQRQAPKHGGFFQKL